MKKKVLKVFIWKFFEIAKVKDWEMFQRLSIFEGKSPGNNLSELISEYNYDQKPEFNLVSESELVEILELKGLKTTRQTLKEWRVSGTLIDEYGNKLSFTDGNSVCYDEEGMINFVSNRKGVIVEI